MLFCPSVQKNSGRTICRRTRFREKLCLLPSYLLLLFFTTLATVQFCLSFVAQSSYGREFIPSVPSEGGVGIFNGSTADISVDPNSGQLEARIPFQLPEARGAVQPSLSFFYTPNYAVREAGTGWGLSLPNVERHPVSGPHTLRKAIAFRSQAERWLPSG
jgi:Salmonella virulence plasmid 65kDa B protein